ASAVVWDWRMSASGWRFSLVVPRVWTRRRVPPVSVSPLICPRPSMPDATSLLLRIAVVDDEPLARAVLCEFLAAEPNVEVVAQCANGFEAVKAVSELTPDLLLLDVQMPKLDGFEVLDLVGRDVAVVFTTAYDQYALRAFEVHAVDYLLKPISAERLSEALVRVRERLGRGERSALTQQALSGALAETRSREGKAHRVLVRDGPRVHVIPVDKIDYVQAQDDYVCFRSEGKDYLKEQTLAETEETLDPAVFVRIHRSYLLNLSRLARVDQDERENRVAVLTDGRRLPVSRSGYMRLNSLL